MIAAADYNLERFAVKVVVRETMMCWDVSNLRHFDSVDTLRSVLPAALAAHRLFAGSIELKDNNMTLHDARVTRGSTLLAVGGAQ